MKPLAVTGVDGHIALAGKQATAWYRLAPVRWNWRPDSEREAMVKATAARLAGYRDHRVHLRVTSRPMSPQAWRDGLAGSAIGPLPGFAAHLDAARDRLAELGLTDKEVFLGVDLPRPASRVAGFLGSGFRQLEHVQLADRVAEIDRVARGDGLDGAPLTEAELEWLIHRSVALGCPPVTGGDLEEAHDRADWTAEPYGPTVKVVCNVDPGRQVTRHVAILTVGRMAGMKLAEPWLAKLDRLKFGYELAATFDVVPPEPVLAWVQRQMLRIRSQITHYHEHDLDPPRSLANQRDRALEIQEDLEAGYGDLSTRTEGWYRIAVSADTEAKALARAAKVAELFAPGIVAVRPSGQYHLAREFIPGEPLGNTAYRRRMPVVTLAAGQPAATATVGHTTGVYLGYTVGAGGRRVVSWDLHRAMEVRERSGLTLIAGVPGSGKSALAGNLLYNAALSGVRCTALDPAGPLARLATTPELADHSQVIDLLEAAPGTLNPWGLIAPPVASHFESEKLYTHALTMADQERRTLCTDVMMMLLPAVTAEHPLTGVALGDAARTVSGPWASPRKMIEALREARYADGDDDLARHSRILARILDDVARLPAAQLIFPSGDADIDHVGYADKRLTVITMSGLTIPKEGVDRKEWTTAERMSVPLLHLAAWLTQRSMHQGEMAERKLVLIDEAHALTYVASGRMFVNRMTRQSRRLDTRLLLISQNVADMSIAGIENLTDTVFVGLTTSADAQRAALEALKVPVGCGYEQVLGGLSPHARGAEGRSGGREFIFNDGEGGVEKIAVDLSPLSAEARAAIDTTAAPTKTLPPVTAGESRTPPAWVAAAEGDDQAEYQVPAMANGHSNGNGRPRRERPLRAPGR